jgi:hypothetical protein
MIDRHIEVLNKQINSLIDALAKLSRETALPDLVKMSYRSGFTSVAELALITAMLNAISQHVSAIEILQKDLLSASDQVGR